MRKIAYLGSLTVGVALTAVALADTPPQFTETGWNDTAYGPLPRYRDQIRPYDPNQSLFPEEIQFVSGNELPSGNIASPPEYSPSDGVLFRYNTGAWPNVVRDLVAELTRPGFDEIAYVIIGAASQQAEATTRFTSAGADMSKVRFIIQPNDSIWARDYGPHFIWLDGTRVIVDSHYYPGRPNDNFSGTLAGDDFYGVQTFDIPLYYSGGNFQPGPNGSGWCTGLIRVDNPGFTDPFISELYNKYQGINTLNILPQFPFSVDGTGHIDMWFYLVDDDSVVISEFTMGDLGLAAVPGAVNPAVSPVVTARDIADNAVPYMTTRGFAVTRLPAWSSGGTHFTYANAFRVNNRIFTPKYGTGSAFGGLGFSSTYVPYDNYALTAWQNAAGPGVSIVPIACFDIIPAAGAIHCIIKQVPRRTDSAPAVTVVSPNGGELLTTGATHKIRWEATDNQSIANVDLYYRTSESGPWQLIAASQPDTGSFDWAVPALYSANARVRVVARDPALNTGEATSDTVFTIAPGARRVYDFSTGAGVDKFGFGFQTSSWSVVNLTRRPAAVATALSAAQYTAISTSNATLASETDPNRYNSSTASSGQEPTHIFEFTVTDPINLLDNLRIEWEGFITDCSQAELYIWDYVANQWADGRGLLGDNRHADNAAFQRRDAVLSANIRSNISRYINGANGQVTLLAYSERGTGSIFYRMCTDYVAVTTTIAYTPGDLNCDGIVNFDDIDGFTTALVGDVPYQTAYPNCYRFLGDANGDSTVNFDDIDAFVSILIGG